MISLPVYKKKKNHFAFLVDVLYSVAAKMKTAMRTNQKTSTASVIILKV